MAAGNQIWTIGKILKWTQNYFAEKGIESPRLDAEVLLGHLLQKERIYLYVHFDEPLQPEELAAFREMIKKRVAHVPVAYIIGEREFMGLKFKVTPATLVPRPDTEILVQKSIDYLKDRGAVRFADIGTGSGAICLSVLHFVPEATADTVDISAEAREVAEENAKNLEVAERIHFYTGDLLMPLAGTYDAILSNPPYIPDGDIAGLAPEVKGNEPLSALKGGTDGLDFYRRLAKDAPAMLNPGGFLALEVGIEEAQRVEALCRENELTERTEIVKDYAGIDRVVIAWRGKN